VLAKLGTLDVSDVGISSITLSELEYGVAKSSKPAQNSLALAQFLAPIEIPSYDDKAARAYGTLRSFLEDRGTPIGSLDMMIAAHALALGSTLVTNNEREFSRVPDLQVVNWVA